MSAIYEELDAWSSGATSSAADLYPCRQSAILSLRQAVVLGDVERARRILRQMDGSVDASQLTDVMHLLVRLRLVPDLLRAGLRAEGLSPTLQGLWLGEAVTAGLVDDARALLQAGFAVQVSPIGIQRRQRGESEVLKNTSRRSIWRYREDLFARFPPLKTLHLRSNTPALCPPAAGALPRALLWGVLQFARLREAERRAQECARGWQEAASAPPRAPAPLPCPALASARAQRVQDTKGLSGEPPRARRADWPRSGLHDTHPRCSRPRATAPLRRARSWRPRRRAERVACRTWGGRQRRAGRPARAAPTASTHVHSEIWVTRGPP